MKTPHTLAILSLLAAVKRHACMDTWDIPYQRRALPMLGGSVAAPLGQCTDNFSTEDSSECVEVEHDTSTGSVNVTLNCCVYNDKMFQKDTMISANAYRCEILVCEEKRSGPGVEIVSKHPVFTEGKQMSGCCLRNGIMYKPGASFYDEAEDKTLVCCSGNIYASLEEPEPVPEPEPEKTVLACPTYSCGDLADFQCSRGKRVVKFELEKTEFALFPSLIHQDGFSMHMYGGRESLKRDCHGHYFFSANVKRSDDQENLAARFMGLERKHNFQGYMMKFTPGFSQAWAKMIDVEEGFNPLVKDVALDSSGKIYALVTYEQLDGEKMMRIQRYDQCGEYIDGADVQAGTFISREAYISIDSNDDVIALHSYSSLQSDISVCHVVKVSSDMAGVVWDSVIENIEGESSCMPSGIKADCEDGVYVTGFMASNKGFVRKYASDGSEVWTKADFLDQITEVVYDPREDVLVLTLSTENIMMVTNQGQVLKTINLKAREIALGDEGYFAFHFMDGQHRIGYMNKELELIRNYDILWQNWNDISWCDNLVPNKYGTEVYLTCSLHDAQDVIIFQTKLGDEKTYLGARAVTDTSGVAGDTGYEGK